MKKTLIAILLALPPIGIIALILLQHTRFTDPQKAFLIDSLSRNDEIALLTSNRWAKDMISSAGANGTDAIIEHLQISNQDSADAALVTNLESEIVRLVVTYSDGSFEAIEHYYISTTSLLTSNAIRREVSYGRQHPLKLLKVTEPQYSEPGESASDDATAAVLVKYDSSWDDSLRALYKNTLEVALLNEFARKSEKAISTARLARMSGAQLAIYLDTSVSNMCGAFENSADISSYTHPWEAFSTNQLFVTVFRGTNVMSSTWQKNTTLLSGPQCDKEIWCFYENTPAQIIKKRGFVWYALFTSVVKPRNLPYYCPIEVCFYYNPVENRWRVWQFACHAQIAPSVPL